MPIIRNPITEIKIIVAKNISPFGYDNIILSDHHYIPPSTIPTTLYEIHFFLKKSLYGGMIDTYVYNLIV